MTNCHFVLLPCVYATEHVPRWKGDEQKSFEKKKFTNYPNYVKILTWISKFPMK